MTLRYQVLAEELRCYRCGGGGTDADIVDHVIPLTAGGTDARENLQRMCRRCHALKTGREATRARQ